MPRPLAELRDAAEQLIKDLRQLRDRYHDKKLSDADRKKAKQDFAEARAKFDAAVNELDEAKSYHDMDAFLDEQEKRFAAGDREQRDADSDDSDGQRGNGRRKAKSKRRREDRSRSRRPGRDDTDLDLGFDDDEGDQGPTFAQRERRGKLAIEGWCIESGERRHRQAMRELGIRSGRKLRYASLIGEDFAKLQAEFRNRHPDAVSRAIAKVFEKRNLSTLQLSKGGVVTSNEFVVQVEVAQLMTSGMLQVAEVIRTPHGSDFPYPTSNDTDNEGEIIGQGAAAGDSVDPDFDHVKLRAHKSHAKPVKVPFEVLEDWSAGESFATWLATQLGNRLGRHRNRKYTVGTGTNEPWGIVPAAPVGKQAAATGAFTASEVISLIYSVDEAYRMGAGFMMSDSVFLEVQLLVDDQGRYIHTPGLNEGARDTIRGYPRHNNTHMATALAADEDVMLFGKLNAYKVREVNQHRMRRFDELYGDQDMVAFDDYIRHDGALIDAGTNPVKKLRMAS